MLIGEGPGGREDRWGIPFCGLAGQELDQTYLRLGGLDRDDVFVTNVVQCRQERNGVDVRPSEALTLSCSGNHLFDEIEMVQPEIIILCGAPACSLVPGIKLEYHHGFPRVTYIGRWKGWVVPMYHPAAGMHESRFMIPMLEDWENFGKWESGSWMMPSSILERILGTEYTLIRPGEFWDAVSSEPEHYENLPVDTESDEGRLWSIQFSTQPGRAFMILREDKQSVEEFAMWLEWTYNGVVMHNATHDKIELAQVGIEPRIIYDTQQELFHLGNLPQALKVAVYRTHGYKMHSYDDTVTPHSQRALDDWLAGALGRATSLRETFPHPIGKGCPTCGKNHRKDMSEDKPHESETVLRRVMGRLGEGDTYDPWEAPKLAKGVEKVRLFGRPWLTEFESAVGRMPRKSIVHVPLGEAVHYGCSDADWTGRLATWLASERKRIVTQEWKVA